MPREADREPVRVGRGEGELPARHAEAPGQLLRHRERVLRREHRRDPARRLLGNCAQRRLRRVAAHRTRVAEAEVDVLVAVDVGEAAPARVGDEEREPAGPLGHPVHRHSGQEVVLRSLCQRARPWVLAREALLLATHEPGEGRSGVPGVRLQSDTSARAIVPQHAGVGLKSDTMVTGLMRA